MGQTVPCSNNVDIAQVNEFEESAIRCVLFHWSSSAEHADQQGEVPPPGWDVRFNHAIIPEQKERLEMMPRTKLFPEDVANLPDGKEILEQYKKWKAVRDEKLYSS